MHKKDIPPTAGLPAIWKDFFPSTGNFSDNIAHLLNIPSPELSCSGTAALIVILKTLAEESRRDTVIIPAYTCPLVALAIAQCNLKIILCDLAENSFDFDFKKLALLANTNTLAIISTHLGGRVANVLSAKKIAQRIGAFVIEDAAQSLGATFNSNSVGLIGDAAFFSMAMGKGLTTYEGGIFFSQHDHLQKKLARNRKKILPFNMLWELRRCLEFIGYASVYHPRGIYYAYGRAYRRSIKTNNWLDAVGDIFSDEIPLHSLGQWRQRRVNNALNRLPDFLQKTRKQALNRIEKLQSLNLVVLNDHSHEVGVWPFLMLLLPTEKMRDAALQKLAPCGLGVTRLFIHALHDYNYLQGIFSSDNDMSSHPNARNFSARLITISNSLWLNDEKFTLIFHALSDILQIEK